MLNMKLKQLKLMAVYRQLSKQLLATVVVVALGFIFTLPVSAYADETVEIQANGKNNHVDIFNLSLVDGKPKLVMKEDITSAKTLRNPNTTVLRVGANAYRQDIPSEFPVSPNGYLLPQDGQDASLLWPGWDNLEVAHAGYNKMKLEFSNIRADGQMHIYLSSSTKPVIPTLSTGKTLIENGASIVENTNTHKHVSWLFSKAGIYSFDVKATAYKNDQAYDAGTARYTFAVDVKNSKSATATSKSECATGYEKKLSPSGKNYCVLKQETSSQPPAVQQLPEQAKASGKCKLVQQVKQARAGDRIKAVTYLKFNVGSNAGRTSGHYDLGSGILGGTYNALIKDDTQGVWVDPSSLTFAVNDTAKIKLPKDLSNFGSKGANVWVIDQVQKPQVPWLGINTQHPSLLANTTGAVSYQMSYSGPGAVAVLSGTSFGQLGKVLLGAGSNQIWTIPANTHVHPNWVFTQPGQYLVQITQTTVATQPVSWVDNVGKNDLGQDCEVSVNLASAGKAATVASDSKQDQEQEQAQNGGLRKINSKKPSENTVLQQETSYKKYYLLALITLVNIVVAAGLIMISAKKLKAVKNQAK